MFEVKYHKAKAQKLLLKKWKEKLFQPQKNMIRLFPYSFLLLI